MSRHRRQLHRRHCAARARSEQAWQRWLLLTGDPEAVAWHTAEAWQKLEASGLMEPGGSCSMLVGPLPVPFLSKGVWVSSDSVALCELRGVVGGRWLVAGRMGSDAGDMVRAGEALSWPSMLMMPDRQLELTITNRSENRGRFRALLVGEAVTTDALGRPIALPLTGGGPGRAP